MHFYVSQGDTATTAHCPLPTDYCSLINPEEEGFEPPSRCRETVFETAAFNHSATPPSSCGLSIRAYCGPRGSTSYP